MDKQGVDLRFEIFHNLLNATWSEKVGGRANFLIHIVDGNPKIVSGGQTGVDRAALDVALELGIPCGGWCPRNRIAEDGRIAERYPLRESATSDPSVRTELNVIDSDATLVLTWEKASGGTLLTILCTPPSQSVLRSELEASRISSFSANGFTRKKSRFSILLVREKVMILAPSIQAKRVLTDLLQTGFPCERPEI
jgi:hypothetical protein